MVDRKEELTGEEGSELLRPEQRTAGKPRPEGKIMRSRGKSLQNVNAMAQGSPRRPARPMR